MAATVRVVRAADIARLEGIENAADRLLVDALAPTVWEGALPGSDRARVPGFILVASEEPDGDAVGFVHVLEMGGLAHLEQLAVAPENARRGHGRALVEAAKREASRRNHDRLTLRTYRDIPWNAPFYATCGFVEEAPGTDFHRSLARVEAELGLDRWGARIQMAASLTPSR